MSFDLIAEMARIQHNERVNASLARAQYTAVDTEAQTTTTPRSGSFTRRVLATAAIALGLSAGIVGALNVVSNADAASTASLDSAAARSSSVSRANVVSQLSQNSIAARVSTVSSANVAAESSSSERQLNSAGMSSPASASSRVTAMSRLESAISSSVASALSLSSVTNRVQPHAAELAMAAKPNAHAG